MLFDVCASWIQKVECQRVLASSVLDSSTPVRMKNQPIYKTPFGFAPLTYILDVSAYYMGVSKNRGKTPKMDGL